MSREHKYCLLCGSVDLKKLTGYEKDYLAKCKNCKFVFSLKKPSKNELIKHYEKYSRKDYLSPVTIKRYNEILDKFEPYRKSNTILDIGCGIGFFLEQAKKRGWKVYGTEFTDEAVKINREKGINIRQGKLMSSNYNLGYFDVITSFEVIEHINNPIEELYHIQKILKEGGVLYFTTPNFNSIERYHLKDKYNAICYPEHLSYYTKKTINYLLKKNGLEKINLETTGVSFTRIKKSKGKSNQKYVSATSDDEIIRSRIEKNNFLKIVKRFINWNLTLFGIGNSLKGFYKKT